MAKYFPLTSSCMVTSNWFSLLFLNEREKFGSWCCVVKYPFDFSQNETSVYSATWSSLPTGITIIQKLSWLWNCCNKIWMASKRNNNEKMVREKTSLDSSSYFHVFNLHTSGRKRPNNKLIAYFLWSTSLLNFLILAFS